MNNVKTVMLLALLTTLLWWMSISLFPNGGFWFGLGSAAVFNLGAYFFSDKVALKMSRAKPVSEQEQPEIYATIRFLAETAEMPMPRIYLIDSPQPNAFATGRNPRHGVVAVTTGLLQIMSQANWRECWPMSFLTSATGTSSSPRWRRCWRPLSPFWLGWPFGSAAAVTGIINWER